MIPAIALKMTWILPEDKYVSATMIPFLNITVLLEIIFKKHDGGPRLKGKRLFPVRSIRPQHGTHVLMSNPVSGLIGLLVKISTSAVETLHCICHTAQWKNYHTNVCLLTYFYTQQMLYDPHGHRLIFNSIEFTFSTPPSA